MNTTLLDPIKIRNLKLKNRMYAAPMVCLYATEEGNVTDRLIDIYRQKAKGGWGLVCVEASTVRYDGRLFPRMLGIYKDQQISGLNELTEVIRENGSKSCIQIMHGGRQANPRFNGDVHPFAPSPISPWPPGSPPPREMSLKDCEEIIDCFAKSASRAKEAGFDCVQLHGAHGFLLQQFLSPYTNQRKDKYGDKLQFLREVISKVREAVGEDFPIGLRISADEFLGSDGLRIDSFVKDFAPAIEEAGIDWLDISAGTFETLIHWVPPLYFKPAYLTDLAKEVKKAVKIPVSGVGKLNNPGLAKQLVESEKVDMVAFGRQSLADPQFAMKVIEGREDEIRRCIYCDLGCSDRLLKFYGIKCAINYEFSLDPHLKAIRKTETPKQVMIVGGGVAGMESARVLTLRGHKVKLYEKDDHLGGLVSLVSTMPHLFNQDLIHIVNSLMAELKKLEVDIVLGHQVSAETIEDNNPDVVILALGTSPLLPNLPGIENKNVMTYEDYLENPNELGDNVVILGGQLGAELAVSIAKRGKNVTLVEESSNIMGAPFIPLGRMLALQEYLEQTTVEVLRETKVEKITEAGVQLSEKNKSRNIPADNIIIALDRLPNNSLSNDLKGKPYQVHHIGDVSNPSDIMNALHQASVLARDF